MRLFVLLVLVLTPFGFVFAQDDGPPIAITSPDTASTFVYGTIKSHSLIWTKNTLIARITFTDEEQALSQTSEDTHEFRIPGITFDAAKGIFYAQTAKGESIPIARIKKTLFVKSIETLPNAHVRVIHPHGNVTVVLEAISPNDPAMHPAPADGDGTRSVPIQSLFGQ